MSSYSDMPVCDLRHVNDAEAIRQIESITDVAVLVLPKDADSEVQSALAAIPVSDVAATVYLNRDDVVRVMNGFAVLTGNDFDQHNETVVIVNGVAIVHDLPENAHGSLIINGMAILNETVKKSRLTIPVQNGMVVYADFDACKPFGDKLELDAEFLSYLQPKTLVCVGNQLHIAEDVTVELLQKTRVQLIVGNELRCYQKIAGYIRATATIGNALVIVDADKQEPAS